MRLVLPSGEYPIDGLFDLSRATVSEILDMQRAVGVGYVSLARGLSRLNAATERFDGSDLAEVVAEFPDATEAMAALMWMARHHAGDRQPNGSPLTLAEVTAVPFADVKFKADPGDAVEVEAPPVPPKARSGSGRAATGKAKKRATSPTSIGPS